MDLYLSIYTPVAELATRIDLGNKGRLTLNPATELDSFKRMLESLAIPEGELNNLVLDGTPGSYVLALNGQAVDIDRGVQDLRYNANLINFLRRLGLTDTTAQAKGAEIKIKFEYTQSAIGFHQEMRTQHRARIAKRYGKSPKNEQELEATLNGDTELKGVFETFLQRLREPDADQKQYGDWVRAQYKPRKYDLPTLFKVINKHKSSLAGCWAIKADGHKWNVPSLSCSKCSREEIEVPSDTVLVCIKRNFWIAAQDYMNQNFTKQARADEPDEEDEIADEEPALRRFAWLIWLIGFVVVGIVVYRVMRR